MAKKNLDKTCDLMKGILSETIDNLSQVAKKSSKGILTVILEQGSENVEDLIGVVGDKLKEKVKTHGKTKSQKTK